MTLAEFGTGQVFWSMLYFFLFFIWIWLLIVVFSDIFRSDDLGGLAKALWVIFVIVVPYLGVFVYLIARGRKMSEHAAQAAQAQDAAQRAYIQSAAGAAPSTADELSPAGRPQGPGRDLRRRVRTSQGQGDRLTAIGRHSAGPRPARAGRVGVIGGPVAKTAVVAARHGTGKRGGRRRHTGATPANLRRPHRAGYAAVSSLNAMPCVRRRRRRLGPATAGSRACRDVRARRRCRSRVRGRSPVRPRRHGTARRWAPRQ